MNYFHAMAAALLVALAGSVAAQGVRMPMMPGTMPGMAQMRAVVMQRHQARTLLYREALEELRRNPAAADLAECASGGSASGGACLHPARAAVAVAPALPTRRRIALLVGNMAYAPPIPRLETPVADVFKIASVLSTRFGYETQILQDASKRQIVAAVNALAAETRPEDSVLVFYAGHGYLMDDINMGFWIPVDGSVKSAANWISNSDIGKLLAAIPARQVMLVSDSCFSGTLAKESSVAAITMGTEQILRRRSVLVMSSGDDEPVMDEGHGGHSIFAWNLARELEAVGGTAPGYQIWRNVHGRVTQEVAQQPQYGAVISAGHAEGGEYLFEAR